MTSQFRKWPKPRKRKKSSLNLIFRALRCLSNQKIREYWQISIWLNQLALRNSYEKNNATWTSIKKQHRLPYRDVAGVGGVVKHGLVVFVRIIEQTFHSVLHQYAAIHARTITTSRK